MSAGGMGGEQPADIPPKRSPEGYLLKQEESIVDTENKLAVSPLTSVPPFYALILSEKHSHDSLQNEGRIREKARIVDIGTGNP
jgi:hypothetical protein